MKNILIASICSSFLFLHLNVESQDFSELQSLSSENLALVQSAMSNQEENAITDVTSEEYNALLKQIDAVETSQTKETYQEALRKTRLDLAIKLCKEDQNACYLIDNYQQFKFDEDLSDKDLSIFGLNFFTGYPLNYDQTSSFNNPSDYKIQRGDILKVSSFGINTRSNLYNVSSEGLIVLKNIGPIKVLGLTLLQARELLSNEISAKDPGAQLFLTIERTSPLQIYTLGAVINPGSYVINPNSKSINAVIASGGFNRSASLRNVNVLREGELIGEVDLYDLLIFGDTSSDVYLQDNDTVLITASNKYIRLEGEVNRPAIYELKLGEKLSDVLKFGLGLTEFANGQATIKRKNDLGQYTTFTVNISNNIEIMPGDEILLGSQAGDTKNYINLIGFIRNPGTYEYSPDSVLGDYLNQNTDLLDSTYLGLALIKRFNPLTRTYRFLNLDLINSTSYNFKLLPKDEIFIISHDEIKFLNSSILKNLFLKENYFSESIQKMQFSDQLNMMPVYETESFNEDDISCLTLVRSFGGQNFIEASSLKLRTVSEKNDNTCTDFLNDYPEIMPYLIASSVPVLGSVENQGLYPVSKEVSAKFLLDVSGGSVSNRKVSYELSNADDLISRNVLESELANEKDIIFLNIKSVSNESSSGFVTIIGEFNFPGTYIIAAETRLSEIYDRSGGLTANAYPEGAILTRDSIRTNEENSLSRARSELADILASAVTSGIIQQSTTDLLSLVNLMNDVSNAAPVGRLVADLKPNTINFDKSLDIILQPGDIIYMPKISNTVTVMGSVLNPVTVPFVDGNTIEDYVKLAGGYKDYADKSKSYVLQPNGSSLIPRNSLFSFREESILPGATIFVPREARPLSGLSLVEALTPVLANLSITMASINSITSNN